MLKPAELAAQFLYGCNEITPVTLERNAFIQIRLPCATTGIA